MLLKYFFIIDFQIIQKEDSTDQNIKKRTKTDFTWKNGFWGEKGTIWEPCD